GGTAVPRRQHALQISSGLVDVAQADRTPLALIGLQQVRAGPAFDRGFELPAEVDDVLDARVHAEPAGRRGEVCGVAGYENAIGAVTVRHQLAAHPGQDRENLEIEFLAHRTDDGLAYISFGQGLPRLVADDGEAPAIAAVDRDHGRPGAFRPDEDVAIARR